MLDFRNIKEFSKKYYQFELSARLKKRKCANPKCSNSAIRSHNISQHFLSGVSDKGHVRMFNVHPRKGIQIERIGISKASAFNSFCSFHDQSLFSLIDNPQMNLSNTRNILLLTYKATIQEKNKKAIKSETYSQALTAFNDYEYPLNNFFYSRIREYKLNFANLDWYANEILSAIEESPGKFCVRTLQIPYHEIIASELFTLEPAEVSSINAQCFERFNHLIPFSNLYVYIIPDARKKFSSIILCMHEKDIAILDNFYRYLTSLPYSRSVSDLLTLYLDTWVCSENFYQTYLVQNIENLKKLMLETTSVPAIARETSLNIFDLQI